MESSSETPVEVSEFAGTHMEERARLVFVTLGWLSCISGIFGNVLIIATLLSQPSLRGHLYNVYIGNLAVADLIAVGYYMPFWLLDLSLGYHPVVNVAHCQANAFLSCTCILASICTLLIIAFNRYLCVCRPNLYTRIFTKTNTVVFCFGLWALAALMSMVPLLGVTGSVYKYNNVSRLCTFSNHRATDYSNVTSIITLMGSTVLIGFFSFRIFHSWRAVRRRVGQWSASLNTQSLRPPVDPGAASATGGSGWSRTLPAHVRKPSQSSLAVVRSLLLVFFLLVIFYMPMAMGMSLRGFLPSYIISFFVFLLLMNHCVNWIVYGAFNQNFRDGYRRLLLGHCVTPPETVPQRSRPTAMSAIAK